MKQTSKVILEKLVQFIAMTIGCVVGLLIYRSCEAKKQAEPEATKEIARKVIGSDYIDLYLGEDNLGISKDDFIKLEKITDEIYVDTYTTVIYVWPNHCPYRPIIEADGTALTFAEWSKRYYEEHHKE